MNYAKIKHYDIANGEGVRMSLFVSGCQFHCKECFNPETWDYNYGKKYDETIEKEIIALISNSNVDGLSILGGDPLWQKEEDIISLVHLANTIKEINKTVWIWSGFTWEYIMEHGTQNQIALIKCCDVWIDGRFDVNLRDLKLQWRGSSNQRVIDVQKSLSEGKVILYD